ncbi:sialidase family protein [Agriterribacter sp.]|uniref:sialidase family protein n=1 Tax=Agriterribacter sp. TaxID=2821509 RepID=UPI002C59A2E1|nr:sialidase family protein [Agriterribacter sp.]HRP54884.1 sialidase family protein [Agriterribacter sp.]
MPGIFYFLFSVMLVAGCKPVAQRSVTGKPDVEKQVALQLDPGNNNPRNSEGDFITLKDGRIFFIYTHYTGVSTSDHAPAYLAGRSSDDGGKTWTPEDTLVIENEGGMNVMSVSLLRLQNGNIALFYLRKNSEQDCIPLMRISTDEAQTWSDAVECITDKKGYFVLNNNRVIQLQSGRLLMPVALHAAPGSQWQNKAILYSYYSDDNGMNWKHSKPVPDSTAIITQEPGVIELKDGSVMMFIRASGGMQQLSRSKDGGETWSHIEPSDIKSPLSPASVARITANGDLVLVWNNNDGSDTATGNKRTPLNIAVSKDEGKTWQNIKTIESDPDGWYCYTAIHFYKKYILLAYCAGSQSKKTHLSVTRISRINLRNLYRNHE